VLVTGGVGFVGSTVVDLLLENGDEPVALDDLSTGTRENLVPSVALLEADISDDGSLRRACAGQRFDAVVHCAAKTKVVESMEKPELYRRVIVDGTANVLAVTRRSGAATFVNISTGGAMYGETPLCASEETPAAPPSPYGRYKLEAEEVVGGASDLRSVTLRLANVYGPRQRTDLEGGVVAIFIGRWSRGEALTVFGDGTAERDYVHVLDCAEAVLSAIRRPVHGVFNIGTGRVVSVNELIDELSALLGPPAGVTRGATRPGELLRSCLDASKAARAGLWSARIALREGLARTLRMQGRSTVTSKASLRHGHATL
jgi:UDP-glucose 4-epimerase